MIKMIKMIKNDKIFYTKTQQIFIFLNIPSKINRDSLRLFVAVPYN
jgi:hypothetical protein